MMTSRPVERRSLGLTMRLADGRTVGGTLELAQLPDVWIGRLVDEDVIVRGDLGGSWRASEKGDHGPPSQRVRGPEASVALGGRPVPTGARLRVALTRSRLAEIQSRGLPFCGFWVVAYFLGLSWNQVDHLLRFRPRLRRTFRFRVRPSEPHRPNGAPCSARSQFSSVAGRLSSDQARSCSPSRSTRESHTSR